MRDPATTPTATPASPDTPSTARVGRKRDAEVLSAAAQVFYERGYADSSVQDVADAVGILKGSLYHYIRTKEDLLYRLLEEVHEEVHEILVEVIAVPDLEPLDRLHLYVRRQIEFNARNLVRISVYYHDVQRLSRDRRRAIYAHRREHEDFVTELVGAAQQAGVADARQDPRVLANCVFGAIIWVYRWYDPAGRVQPVELARSGADFAVAGVRAASSA